MQYTIGNAPEYKSAPGLGGLTVAVYSRGKKAQLPLASSNAAKLARDAIGGQRANTTSGNSAHALV